MVSLPGVEGDFKKTSVTGWTLSSRSKKSWKDETFNNEADQANAETRGDAQTRGFGGKSSGLFMAHDRKRALFFQEKTTTTQLY